jgi:uncharacterized RDD family membrane protein YckC
MKTIQIVTPQNVLIEHELASVILRAIAFAVDQVAIILFVVFAYVFAEILGMSGGVADMFFYVFVLPIYFLYSLVFEWRNYGQTLGKMMIGLKVRRLDGNEIGFTEAATRWMMRIVDIFATAGSLAALLISSTERGQRLGDILAGTMVIRQVPGNSVSLDQLLNINTKENYQPVFLQVQRLKEEDVVLIKQTLVRSSKYTNDAHKTAVNTLVKKLEDLLEISSEKMSQQEFLRTLIKDYIVLTR